MYLFNIKTEENPIPKNILEEAARRKEKARQLRQQIILKSGNVVF
jgi:hypothetical protein